MGAPKVMSGARARVGFVDPNTGQFVVVGIYTSFSYSWMYEATPSYILGRYSPADIDYTASDMVQCTASGWRVVGFGAHKVAGVPKLADLLTHDYLTIAVFDRQTNRRVATIRKVRPLGYNSALTARQLTEMTMPYVGTICDDEDTSNAERFDSTDLPG